jgi:hypothetical protein
MVFELIRTIKQAGKPSNLGQMGLVGRPERVSKMDCSVTSTLNFLLLTANVIEKY